MSNAGIKIARNTGTLVAVEVLSKILGIVLALAIARKLGPANFGLLAFAGSFAYIFGVFTHFGFDKLVLREIGRDPKSTAFYLNNMIGLRLVLSTATFLAIFGALSMLNYSSEKSSVIYVAALIMITESFIVLLNSFYRAHQKVRYEAIVEMFLRILIVSGGLIVLLLGYGLLELLLVQLLIFLISLALSFYLFHTRISKIVLNQLSVNFCSKLIRRATPFLVLSISIAIYAKIDTVMLSFIKGDQITGWYSAAYKFLEVFTFIPAAFVAGILPAMSRFSKSAPELLSETYQKAAKYLFIIALPITVGTVVLADRIILVLYGGEYVNSVNALRILIWALILAFVNYVSANALFAIDKEKVFVLIVIFGALFNICANLVLIPTLSYIGASISTVATEGAVFIVSLFFVSLYLGKISIHQIVSRPMVSVALMAVTTWLLKGINIALLIPLSAIVYGATLFLLKVFDEKELILFGSLFKKSDAKST